MTRQYYYWMPECEVEVNDAGCVCWHDIGTGPLSDATEQDPPETDQDGCTGYRLTWRDKPTKWTALIMPNDALPPDSLVGRMLNADKVHPELLAEATEFLEEYADDFKALAAIERTELPLWRVMHAGYWTEAGVDVDDDFPPPVPECYAAEIEALRDWLKSRLSHLADEQSLRIISTELTAEAEAARSDK